MISSSRSRWHKSEAAGDRCLGTSTGVSPVGCLWVTVQKCGLYQIDMDLNGDDFWIINILTQGWTINHALQKMGLIYSSFHDPEMERYIPAWHVQHDWIQLPAGGLHDTIDSAWRSRASSVSSNMDKRGVYYDLPTHVHPKNRQIPCPTLMPHFAGWILPYSWRYALLAAEFLPHWMIGYSPIHSAPCFLVKSLQVHFGLDA